MMKCVVNKQRKDYNIMEKTKLYTTKMMGDWRYNMTELRKEVNDFQWT